MPLAPFVPAELASLAQVPDMGRVRLWGDASAAEVKAFLDEETPLLLRRGAAYRAQPVKPVSHILALSGGADDGAFGAGVIVGWGRRGDRPTFDVVTGVSAGALVAPFAFLGAAYDVKLSQVFTEHAAGEIYRAQPLAALFGGPAVADNAPLADLIARYVDRGMLRAVAHERSGGRYLIIGTTNLHAERPVFWDMGRIAQRNSEDALDLFRRVLLASTAVPGVFPPVQIKVKAGGQDLVEVHVDGGPTREVFLSPTGFSFKEVDAITGAAPRRRLWVIRNGKITPEYQPVDLSAAAIAVRSLATLTKNQGLGDLLRMYQRARADGMDFNLAAIPPDFVATRAAPFERDYMRALYARGEAFGLSGEGWAKSLPEAVAGHR